MLDFNPFDPGIAGHLYDDYARLRDEDPVHLSSTGMWFVSRYVDVAMVIRDPRFVKRGYRRLIEQSFGQTAAAASLERWIFFADPPEHTRLRAPIAGPFAHGAVEKLRQQIELVVDQLIDGVRGGGRMDLLNDMAYKIPVIIIARILGLPPQDHPRFEQWTRDFALGSEPVTTPEIKQRGSAAYDAMAQYFGDLVAERTRRPGPGLIGSLAAMAGAPGGLGEADIIVTGIQLLFAGYEMTANLIGNAMFALLRNPDQWSLLKEDLRLVAPAVEEALRYDSPGQILGREAATEVQLSGRTIPQGALVGALLGAAHRDPEQFADPDRFDVCRTANRHLMFGVGIHSCLGVHLARLEGRVALAALAKRLPSLALDEPAPTWRPSAILRGLESLPVSFRE